MVDHGHAELRATAVVLRRVAVKEILSDRIALVVLIDPDPAHERVPHDRVDPRVLERGGGEARRIPVQSLQRRVDEDDAETEAEVNDRLGFRFVQRAHRLIDVLRGLRDRGLRNDANALAATRTTQILHIGLTDQVLLDKNADLGEAPLGHQVGDEDRFVGQRTLRKGERPLAEPVIGAGDADRRHLEALLDSLARRHTVVGDVRPEHHKTPFVDELPIGVDDRLDRPFRQALHLAIDHLHGPVQHALFDRLGEDKVEGLSEGGEQILRKPWRQCEVHQVADLDRLCCALVGHATSSCVRRRQSMGCWSAR